MDFKLKESSHWVIVTGWLTFGGAERQALHLADSILERGDRVSVIGLSAPGVLIDKCKEAGIECYYYPLNLEGKIRPRMIVALYGFWKLLNRLNPTYIAPYCMPPNIACGILWRLTSAKMCIWQQRDEGRLRQNKVLEKIAVTLIPRYISNSHHAGNWLSKELKVDKTKISVINNGVSIPRTVRLNIFRNKHGISRDHFVISMIANLHSFKDHMTLLQATLKLIDMLKDSNQPINPFLVLAGNHEDTYNSIIEYVAKHNMTSLVLCPGVVKNVDELLADTDLMAFSSLNEGCPNAVLEGMAAGLAIVGVNTPAVREAVGDSGLELLSKPKDPTDMALKLYLACTNAQLRKEHGIKNKERIIDKFSIAIMAENTISQFTSISKYVTYHKPG